MKPKIKEILFDAFAVICVLVGFSIHSWPSLCFLLAGSFCGSFALYFTLLNNRVHGVSESQARNWAWVFFAISLIGVTFFWRECKQPTNLAESKPHPHFTLSLLKPATDISEIDLTNAFLFEQPFSVPLGFLIFPTTEKSKVVWNLRVRNNSPTFVEYVAIVISIPREFSCVADQGWQRITAPFVIDITNSPDAWMFELRDMLPYTGIGLPFLRFSNINSMAIPNTSCGIMVRPKGSPAQILRFQIMFRSVSTNAPSHPFFVLSRLINGHIVINMPPEKAKELSK